MIRRANIDDFMDVYNILLMGRELHRRLNINQWTISFFTREEILEIIDKFYLYIIDNKIAGVMYINRGYDKDYNRIDNGRWLNNDSEYMVIHRVAVHEDYYGRGIATRLIDYAINEAKKASLKSIRIDTHPDNLPMQKTIAKHSFIKCGIIYIDNKYERYAYEMLLK